MLKISEEVKVIKRYKPFVLGFCLCKCGQEINIRSKLGHLKRFERHHGSGKDEYCCKYYRGYSIDSNGYIVLIRRGHPNSDVNGNIRAHRWIMSEWLERPLEKHEDVHHVDGNV